MSDGAMEIPEWALSLPFDTDEREFVRGFQLGAIWGRIDDSTTVLVYADSAEMLARIRERHPDAFSVDAVQGDDLDGLHVAADDWLAVTFGGPA